MHIPVRFGLVGPNGADLDFAGVSGGRVDGDVIHLTEAEQTFVFDGVSAPPVPSLLRGFSAPVKLEPRPHPGRPPVPAPHRRRRLQPLAGVAAPRQCRAHRRHRRGPRGEALVVRPGLHRCARRGRRERRAGAGIPRAGPAAPGRVRHRPRDRPRRRSRCDRRRPRIASAPRSPTASAAASPPSQPHLPSDAPFSPDAASAGRRALVNAALDLTTGNGITGRRRP